MANKTGIYSFDNIKEELKEALKPTRYAHVIGVAYTCANLAMRYDIDLNKAYLAGLLHDCAKAYPIEAYIDMAKEYSIDISDAESKNPQLLHAKLGGYFAKTKYGVSDPDIISSILSHTTGIDNMSILAKIVFVADYIEPGRNEAPNLDVIRKEAYEDIDICVLHILSDTLLYLKEKNYVIDDTAIKAYEYYKGVLNDRS